MKNIKVLLSVYNISGYLISELRELCHYAEIVVLETPCKGIGKENLPVRWLDRTKFHLVFDVNCALNGFAPDIFLCGGWSDKLCLDLAKFLKRAGTTNVLLVDTPWQGRLKQFFHCFYSRFYLTSIFNYAWCAGAPQERYLRYLGFSLKRIRRGYYCADTNKFAPIGEKRFNEKGEQRWPHTFLYIGRYVAVKNMRRMELAFIKAVERMPESDWTLRCIGGGELWNERTIHPRIEHLGYKSPSEIQDYVKDAGCFVLPSVYEPWGVVVHEAALMGLPMLCSNQIQAATAYLRSGENGYLFNPHSEDELAGVYLKIMQMADADLVKMSRCSFQLGMRYTTEDWAETVCRFRSNREMK